MQAEINRITECLIKALDPLKIYLFGSFAYGTPNEDSDYDFYVIVPDGAGRSIELERKAYNSLRGMPRRSVDILVSSESVFNDRVSRNTLEGTVGKEGVVLYERQKGSSGVA